MDANKLIDAIEEAGFTPRSYSGRGMYGKRCVGVTTANPFRLGCKLAEALLDDEPALVRQLTGLTVCTDSMGRNNEIVYFPQVEWPAGREDESEEVKP